MVAIILLSSLYYLFTYVIMMLLFSAEVSQSSSYCQDDWIVREQDASLYRHGGNLHTIIDTNKYI